MGTDNPLIAILMAVYQPRLDWLREQLLSLNAQTYPNLRLYVRDDSSPTVPFETIQALVGECITVFPYTIQRNEKNLGSNGTFERLTREAEGEYFAYCDQDDVWLPEKLTLLAQEIKKTGAGLVCTDVIPIDGDGREIGSSIRDFRPRHIFHSGSGLAPQLIYRNFVIGCTMLIRAEVAREALPFAKSMVHDHYLAFACATRNKLAVCDVPLVRYRLHEDNQTLVLAKIQDKRGYVERHMLPFCQRVEELSARYEVPELRRAAEWAEARRANASRQPGGVRAMLRSGGVNRPTTLFEVVGLRLPGPLFRFALKLIQQGRI